MSKELTEEEKIQLRKLRFSSGANMSSEEAKDIIEKEKQKLKDRLLRFNPEANSGELTEEKLAERAKRFGITTKEEELRKLEERKKRFSTGEPEDVLNKRKERFKDQFDPSSTAADTKKEAKKNLRRRLRGKVGKKRVNIRERRNININKRKVIVTRAPRKTNRINNNIVQARRPRLRKITRRIRGRK